MRTVVFGVDGLTFRVLQPLIERGDLPNFKKLSQEGCESTLQSKYPPLTPPAWTSLSTAAMLSSLIPPTSRKSSTVLFLTIRLIWIFVVFGGNQERWNC